MFGKGSDKRKLDGEATRRALINKLKYMDDPTTDANRRRLGETAVLLGVVPTWLDPLPACCCHSDSCACCLHSECGRCCACQRAKRPDFGPTQVRCLCQVRKGHRYIARYSHSKDSSGTRWTATSDPFKDKDGEWWVTTREESGYEGEHSLADCGVVMYQYHCYVAQSNCYSNSNRYWNKTNWLEYADKCDIPGRHCGWCGCGCQSSGCCGNICCPCYVAQSNCYSNCCWRRCSHCWSRLVDGRCGNFYCLCYGRDSCCCDGCEFVGHKDTRHGCCCD